MSNVTYERVNWEDSPSENTPINQTNLNKMDKGIADCATAVNSCNERVEECFQSASDGKALIASAITGKGIETASDATYAVMAGNIEDYLVYPQGTKSITSNGEQDVTDYKKVTVNVKPSASISGGQNLAVGSFSAVVGDYYIIFALDNDSWRSRLSGATILATAERSNVNFAYTALVRATSTTVSYSASYGGGTIHII